MKTKNPQPNELNEALWEFPCRINVKAMGLAEYPLEEIITEIAQQHCSEAFPDSIETKASRTGKYRSITITVQVESKLQVENLYVELGRREEIKWTL